MHTLGYIKNGFEKSIVCLCGFILDLSVNSYGHVGMVSSPNHTFSWASLAKRLTSTSCTYNRLYLTATLLESAEGRRMAVEMIKCSCPPFNPKRYFTYIVISSRYS